MEIWSTNLFYIRNVLDTKGWGIITALICTLVEKPNVLSIPNHFVVGCEEGLTNRQFELP